MPCRSVRHSERNIRCGVDFDRAAVVEFQRDCLFADAFDQSIHFEIGEIDIQQIDQIFVVGIFDHVVAVGFEIEKFVARARAEECVIAGIAAPQ